MHQPTTEWRIINSDSITLEEHISFPEKTKLISVDILGSFGQSPAMQKTLPNEVADITNERLACVLGH